MAQLDGELLEKFNKIYAKQQAYKQQSQEQSSDDDEPMSFASYGSSAAVEPPSSALNSIGSIGSSLSYSSSNASSVSVTIGRKAQSTLTNNLKNQFINSINQRIDHHHQTHRISHPNGLRQSSSQSTNHQEDRQTNSQTNHQTNHHTNRQTIHQMNSAKSTSSIDESQTQHDEHADEHPLKRTRRTSMLIEKMNSLTVNGHTTLNDDEHQSELSNSSDSNLNEATLAPINLSNLVDLAKHSNPSDSNLSDAPSDSNMPCDSTYCNSIERDDDDELIVTNPFANIKLNPFLQKDQKVKMLFKAAKEIRDSEKNYVDGLELICVKYKAAVTSSIPPPVLDQLLQPFGILLQLNTVLLNRFNHCIKNYDKHPKIANVLVDLGPFLKHYADFFTKFEKINTNFADMKKKYPAFKEATERFEQQPVCNKLTLSHYMLKPIQRIGHYKLLIEKYIKYLQDEQQRHPDYNNAIKALDVVTKAAEYSNERMRENENFTKLLAIQQCIIGGHKDEIIKPYRRLIKQGILHKISRKVRQERLFILCNDCLIYLTILKENTYKVNHEMSLVGMRISSPEQEAFQNEILIRSSQRSIRVVASSLSEKQDWMNAIDKQIEQTQSNMRRRSTLNDPTGLVNTKQLERPVCLGEEAPIWTPDKRVSMCQKCTLEFTLTNRRHHCRACGAICCSKCSKQTHYLAYLKRKQRVCRDCFDTLTKHAIPEQDENTNQENLGNLNNNQAALLSSSDPTLNLNSNDRHSVLSQHKKMRRNSSNLTSFGSMSSRYSSFIVEEDQAKLNEDKPNDDLLSSLLDEQPKHIDRQTSLFRNNSIVSQYLPSATDRSTTGNEEPPPAPPLPTPQPEIQRNLTIRQSGRRRIAKVLTEVSANEKEFDMAGYMFKRKSKKNWRKFWFLLKSHVLYSFKQAEDVIAMESLPILGYTVQISQHALDGQPANLILQLTHQNLPDLHFRLETEQCVEKCLRRGGRKKSDLLIIMSNCYVRSSSHDEWFKALKEATTV